MNEYYSTAFCGLFFEICCDKKKVHIEKELIVVIIYHFPFPINIIYYNSVFPNNQKIKPPQQNF